jgi:hypothetical protein
VGAESGVELCPLIAQSSYDGCMLDTPGVAPLTAGYYTLAPYNAATGANWTRLIG